MQTIGSISNFWVAGSTGSEKEPANLQRRNSSLYFHKLVRAFNTLSIYMKYMFYLDT